MGAKSKIQWCDATINPCMGCSPVSPACDNCYAARMAHRLAANIKIPPYFVGLTDAGGKWTGRINLHVHLMKQVLRWQKPRRIFVGSMTDLFHENVPDEFLDQVFGYVALAPRHTFLVLTKRPERMRDYVLSRTGDGRASICRQIDSVSPAMGNRRGALEMPLPNVWLGVTAEDQAMADLRIPILLKTPAAIHFVSVEPTLGPVDISTYLDCSWACPECGAIEQHEECHREDDYSYHHCLSCGYTNDNYEPWGGVDELDWVIAGGESGPNVRFTRPEWVRSLRDQCQSASVPFFFKQWGEFLPDDQNPKIGSGSGGIRVGKRAAGRLLDGQEHNAFPEVW